MLSANGSAGTAPVDSPEQHAYEEYLATAVSAAKAAGDIIATAFRQPKQVVLKGAVDLVTETDKACEALILLRIQTAYPTHRFIGEEGSAAQGFASVLTDEPTWMADPLDGTTNFVHGFPFVCVSLALVICKRIVVGVVYNPILGELFTAVAGGGAYLNGQPIHVSAQAALGSALVASEIGTTRDATTVAAIFDRLSAVTAATRSVRCSGSCAMNLCGVACGRLDAFYEVGFGGCWDAAAGVLIVMEAGGSVLDPAGGKFNLMGRRVLATNAALAQPMAAVLAACKTSPAEPGPSSA